MQRSHDGIAWRAIRRFGRTVLGIVGYQPTEWWALAWVCVFRKALVSGINWSRKGSGYLRELTYSSLPRSSLYLSLSIHLVVSVSLANGWLVWGCRVISVLGCTSRWATRRPPFFMALLALPPTHDYVWGNDIIRWLVPCDFYPRF